MPFTLDGRWLHAFNGPGMALNAAMGNFRYNGLSPNAQGMDEDYDACDLENWFLAIQSADGQVMIPSFHRPGIIRYDLTNPNAPVNDWQRLNYDGPNQTAALLDLRLADPPAGHGRRQRPGDLPRPDPRSQHRQDHLRRRQRRRRRHRLGLARPGLSGPARLAGPALQAAVRLHGHRPQRPDPAQHRRQPRGQSSTAATTP